MLTALKLYNQHMGGMDSLDPVLAKYMIKMGTAVLEAILPFYRHSYHKYLITEQKNWRNETKCNDGEIERLQVRSGKEPLQICSSMSKRKGRMSSTRDELIKKRRLKANVVSSIS